MTSWYEAMQLVMDGKLDLKTVRAVLRHAMDLCGKMPSEDQQRIGGNGENYLACLANLDDTALSLWAARKDRALLECIGRRLDKWTQPPIELPLVLSERERLERALAQLDPADDDHWTVYGEPAISAVLFLYGEGDIRRAAPDLKRYPTY